MTIDFAAAADFVTTHARTLDRHRLSWLIEPTDEGTSARALAALRAYRNADGGYGWGLEPDLRSKGSQPGGALHAFEVWAELGSADPDAAGLCDWLASVSLPDDGLPFALPISDPVGCAPWWVGAESAASSLQITAAVVANALPVAAINPGVAGHPWLHAATRYCLDAIRAIEQRPAAHILTYSLRVLDQLGDGVRETDALIQRLLAFLPPDGIIPVDGGADGEALRPLDYSPAVGTIVRAQLPPASVAQDLQRLMNLQQADGGWPLDWGVSSPVAALEWRGYVTVRALRLLHQNVLLPLEPKALRMRKGRR